MRPCLTSAAVLALLAAGGVAVANANPPRSQYTTIELKACKIVRRHPDGNSWLCPGLEGHSVYFAEGDHRTYVSYGRAPAKHRAAAQTLGAFNSLFPGKVSRATVEWRISQKSNKVVPHAAILRYFTSVDGRKGQVLVVTKIGANESCHVAHIDALANPDAIAIARRIADDVAPKFDCKTDPQTEGAKGKSPL